MQKPLICIIETTMGEENSNFLQLGSDSSLLRYDQNVYCAAAPCVNYEFIGGKYITVPSNHESSPQQPPPQLYSPQPVLNDPHYVLSQQPQRDFGTELSSTVVQVPPPHNHNQLPNASTHFDDFKIHSTRPNEQPYLANTSQPVWQGDSRGVETHPHGSPAISTSSQLYISSAPPTPSSIHVKLEPIEYKLEPEQDKPILINPRQYERILKRRIAREKFEKLHNFSRQRKPYIHESRHQHAMRRPRGPGGRFLTAEKTAELERQGEGDLEETTETATIDRDSTARESYSAPPPVNVRIAPAPDWNYSRRNNWGPMTVPNAAAAGSQLNPFDLTETQSEYNSNTFNNNNNYMAAAVTSQIVSNVDNTPLIASRRQAAAMEAEAAAAAIMEMNPAAPTMNVNENDFVGSSPHITQQWSMPLPSSHDRRSTQ